MFSKILIANRGEIACRIMTTAKAMGIATVAVYSDADANGEHVAMADEAVRIGPSPSAESYLKAATIIEAAKATGAEAIHPGFGFLSENAEFVKAVEAAGLVFIGPDETAIASMGDKITSKGIAEKAGVSTVPGTPDAVEDVDVAAKMAEGIGYPVMIKASAGGGGKGMRIAHDEAELRVSMPQAQNEAASSFGDARVFIEKFVTNPRHIEIQVLADTHGNTIYLGERECSLQRRHQKVFEEAPSPFISDATRQAMGQQAVDLAKAVGYRSAGTVEFIVGANEDFYFLEMNTRLQVEHPVTELVYGLDLVEWMIRIAAGEKLTIPQTDVKPKGWAMEARVYAEDPSRGFLPSIGRLTRYQEPQGEGVRVDSGIAEGGEISMFYDPMIAKLITWGETRIEAIDRLASALDGYVIEGLGHNRQFLRHVCDNADFRNGDMTTGFIGETYPDGYTPGLATGEALGQMRALAVLLVADRMHRIAMMGGGALDTSFVLHDDHGATPAMIEVADDITITIEDMTYAFAAWPDQHRRLFSGTINGEMVQIQFRRTAETVGMTMAADQLTVLVLPARAADAQAMMPVREAGAGAMQVVAPMPGLLTKLLVEEGDTVTAGDDVAVIEAMKMENLLKADATGIVAEIHASEGDSLNVDEPILTFANDD
ncbi:MAG: acetyl/propionyl/methylcrotonyl-CoA carboxylase subunit alpha [Alphaproteobacteria bacterium]|nr:acetyl/propionyl/methylcrotonyl-CoA carboxylase subunit alpha [Alphaproteobacteria bacterium]